MKMTIHQRLSAQRKAEHWKAVSARHRREVMRDSVSQAGSRCYDCHDVPLTEREMAAMSEEDWHWYRQGEAMYRRWDAEGALTVDAEDSIGSHIRYALGYR